MKPCISTYIWPGQTHFGFGAAGLAGREAKARRAKRVFIVADAGVVSAGLVEPIAVSLEAAALPYTLYDHVVSNPDTASVDAAGQAFRESKADFIIGIGGGSSLDTAKAVGVLAGGPPQVSIADYSPFLGEDRRPVPAPQNLPPLIAIPTTAGTGSEATPWALVIDNQACKMGIGNAATVPTVALVDPELTMTLSPSLTAASGMDALSHCIEAYVSTNENPLLDPMILFGIELIGKSLRVAVAQGTNPAARQDVMQGALIGGIAISSKWLGACHSLAHPLSGLIGVPHGVAAGLMLPYQMAYSLAGAMERYARIGRALDKSYPNSGSLRRQAERAVEGVRELIQDIGLPACLQDVGVKKEILPQLAAHACHDANWSTNPRRIGQADMEALYRQAF